MKIKTHRFRFILIWLLTVILTLAIFVFAAFGFIFHVLYPKGGEMFASDLMQHSFTKWIPPIYYSSDKMDEIRGMREQDEYIEETATVSESMDDADGDE